MKHSIYQLAALAIGLFWWATEPAFAQAFFTQPREFIIDHACDAYTSLKKKTGAVNLTVGQTYAALGENKAPGGTHAYLKLDGEFKWVELGCGHYADGGAAGFENNNSSEPAANGEAECLPFFDNEDNPVKVKIGGMADITPPAPSIEPFGLAVNATCGPAGKTVSRDEFQELLRAHPDVLQRIQAFTHNRVYADRPEPASTETYLNDLTDAWFNIHAFDHILCGEPGAEGKIGGLHFRGRYLQLQENGDTCRMANYRQNEVVPGVIYTMGVAMKGADGHFYRHATKGYGLTLSAEDILKTATRAFAENPTPNTASTACLLPLADDGHTFVAVFVRRNNGIRTFYPDATPAPGDPVCTLPINLQ